MPSEQPPPPPRPGRDAPNIPTTRQIATALGALTKLGAIHHDRHHITITDHALLARIANLQSA